MRERRKEFEFDRENVSFRKARRSLFSALWKHAREVVSVILVTLALSVICYSFLALFVNTETDSRLKRENRMYEKMYESLLTKERMVEDVVAGLQMKDDRIYEDVFHASAPSVNPSRSFGLVFGDKPITQAEIVDYAASKSRTLCEVSSSVDAAFERVFEILSKSDIPLPPMKLPLKEISYPQIGASMGNKMNPFYKAYVNHSGLDLIAPRGEAVYAPAGGVVSDVIRSRKGPGHKVVISHAGDYSTSYSHLSAVNVSKGQTVKEGQQIGQVGMSGTAFAPHLHYEICRGDVTVDPINYFFASLSPLEYANMLFMAVNTQQSLD